MGSVAITFRIMPDDAETDLEEVKSRVRTSLAGSLRDLREQPVAFGLKAILAIAVVSDSSGSVPPESLTTAIARIALRPNATGCSRRSRSEPARLVRTRDLTSSRSVSASSGMIRKVIATEPIVYLR